MRQLLLALILSCLAGCGGPSIFSLLISETAERRTEVPIYGHGVDSFQVGIISEALKYLPAPLIVPNLEIYIIDDQEHLGKTWNGIPAIGHHHSELLGRVCILRGYLSRDVIWHEVGHAYHRKLNLDRSDFSKEWRAIAGNVYAKKENGEIKDGFLTDYARGDYEEDVAEWVEECYKHLFWSSNSIISRITVRQSDSRYRRKLALLYKYGFFSDDGYAKLKPLFE